MKKLPRQTTTLREQVNINQVNNILDTLAEVKAAGYPCKLVVSHPSRLLAKLRMACVSVPKQINRYKLVPTCRGIISDNYK